MPSVGLSELALLFVIGLLILGPERLPRVASQLGRWVGRARRTANQLRYQLEREVSLNDLDPLRKPSPPRPAARTEAAPAPASASTPGSATVTAAAAAPAVSTAAAAAALPEETATDSHQAAETVARAAEAAALPSTDAADGSETIRKP